MIFARLLSIVLFVVGFAGFTAPFWLGSVKGVEAIELPLTEINDVSVSGDGRLYFALMHLSRVQVHDSQGRFIRNFAVDNSGGGFCLDIDGDRLTVAVARRNASSEFDLDGRQLSGDTRLVDRRYEDICKPDPRLRSVDWAVSEIMLTFADNSRLSIARQPWHYLALHVFLSWFFVVIALFLWPEWRRGVLKQLRRKRNTA